ncbi:MAG TPA: alpha/beta hydrolase [Streptomyces sp.]
MSTPTPVIYRRAGLSLAGDHWSARPAASPRGTAVLLHGAGQTRHSWHHTAARLAGRGWTALTLDARGHGDSDWARPHGYTVDHLVDDLVHVTGTLGDTPVLIGASLGGMTALLAHADHTLARALVLVDIAPRINPAGAARILDFMTRHRDGFATLNEAAAAITAYNPHRPRPATTDGLRKNLRQHRDGRWYWHWDPQLLQFVSDTAALADLAARMDAAARRITIPTLLIHGELSDIVDHDSVDHLLHHIPTADTATVTNTAHMVAGDDNDMFTNHLIDFLNQLLPVPRAEL